MADKKKMGRRIGDYLPGRPPLGDLGLAKHQFVLFVLILIVIPLAACSPRGSSPGSGSNASANSAGSQATGGMSGFLAQKTVVSGSAMFGPVSSGIVSAYLISSTGEIENTLPLATAVTSSTGTYNLEIPNSSINGYPIAIELSSGFYKEEASGATVNLSNQAVHTILPALTPGTPAVAAVTPLTELAYQNYLYLKENKSGLAANLTIHQMAAAANTNVAKAFGLADIVSTVPMNPSGTLSGNGPGQYTSLLLALSKLASDSGSNSLNSLDGMSQYFVPGSAANAGSKAPSVGNIISVANQIGSGAIKISGVVAPPSFPSLSSSGASCQFGGQTVLSGNSVPGYSATEVPSNSSCSAVSISVSCNNGFLSPSNASATCAPQAAASCSFGGNTLASGSSVSAFKSATVPFGSSCSSVAETVSCNNGLLSPTNASPSCSVLPTATCSFGGKTLASGSAISAYSSATVPFGTSCSSVTETVSCANGVLSPANAFSACTVSAAPPVATCSFGGKTLPSGSVTSGYSSATVPFGSSCSSVAENVSCTNGVLSPSNAIATCSVQPAAPCTFGSKTIASGSSSSGYSTATVPFGSSCSSVAETVSCTNGILSPANANASCSVQPGAPCSFGGNSIASGSSATGYTAATVPFGSSCSSVAETVSCTNGALSPANAIASCSVQAPASCTFGSQTIASGSSATGYSTASVASGSSCSSVSEAVSCMNGVLSPSNASATCSVSASELPTLHYASAQLAFSTSENLSFTPTISGVSSCSVSPALPSGLSIDASTCAISGMAISPAKASNYTVTASNANGSVTTILSIGVPWIQSFVYSGGPFTYFLKFNSDDIYPLINSLPTNDPSFKTNSISNCSVSPALPNGLFLNSTTCAILAGFPEASSAAKNYTVTAVDNYGYSTSATVSIAIANYNLVWGDPVVDSQGNIFLMNSASSGSGGSHSISVQKYDSNGAFLLSFPVTINSSGNTSSVAATTDVSGNFYLTINVTNSSTSELYTAKYSPIGSKIWDAYVSPNKYGSSIGNQPVIAVDPNGIVYVAGTQNYDSLEDINYFLVQYDANGNQKWLVSDGGLGTVPTAITTDSMGNVYMAGVTTASIDGQPGPSAQYGQIDFITKYSVTGARLWTKRTGENTASAGSLYRSLQLGTDSLGNLYSGNQTFIAQYKTVSGLSSWTSSSSLYAASYGNEDIFVDSAGNNYMAQNYMQKGAPDIHGVSKFNSSGVLQWTMNGFLIGQNYVIGKDSAGNLLIVGARSSCENPMGPTPNYSDGESGVGCTILYKLDVASGNILSTVLLLQP